ncbi:hypothetical protein [uncultured Hymenobacter sp.]|uniref:hypothetical protein n=1 Tax=uncultured Hymenobacter sp. TaxID=170016 RepID=UPI0035CBBFD9
MLGLCAAAPLGHAARAQASGPGVHGARAAGLSNASVALAGEVWAVGNNAAGLGELSQPTGGAYAENRYFSAALNVAALVVALPLGGTERAAESAGPRARRGVVGLEAQRFGGALYNETRLAAGYGYRLGLVAVGARLEVLQLSLEGLGSRRVLLASLGGQVEMLPKKLTFGAYLYNLNQARLADYLDERVPTVLKAGLAYRPAKSVLLCVETEKEVERAANFKAGLEYQLVPVLAARLGFASLSEQTTAGLGLRFGRYAFDYAAAWQTALGLSQQLSLSLRFEKSER